MIIDSKKSAYLSKLEFILDESGKKHYVYPMKLKDLYEVQELFSKINDEFVILNLPTEETNDDGEVILNTEKYDVMWELLELALHDTKDNIEQWIDLLQVSEVLAMYRNVSQLKKKLNQMESEITNLTGTLWLHL